MTLNFDLISLAILIVFLLNSAFGIIVFLKNKKSSTNKWYFRVTLTVAAWCLSMVFYRAVTNYEWMLLLSRILYVSAVTIPIAFAYFVLVFPSDNHKFEWWQKYLFPLPALALVAVSIIPNQLIESITVVPDSENIIVFNPLYHLIYGFYISFYFLYSFYVLGKKYVNAGGILRDQLLYVFIGTILAASIGVFSNLLLLMFDIFTLNWLGQVGIIFMVSFIAIAILKHHLFNAKVISVEIVAVILVSLSVFDLYMADTTRQIIFKLAIFAGTFMFSAWLIRSVIHEVESREKIEKLAGDLEKANSSLAAANDRLKEVDQLKSEFVSLATHQIRSPLTAIKGYASMIIEGDYGEVNDRLKEPIQTIFTSCNNLVTIVGDFLDISRIEQGRMKYEMSVFDMKALAEEVVNEYKPNIEKARLTLTFSAKPGEYAVCGDRNKIRQVVGNLIDNSIKYTPKGSISVTVSRNGRSRKISLSVSDTGVGISSEDLPKLFQKFTRAKDASKTNVSGTGLGLYVAKSMIEAHKGRMWAESEGLNKGSKFSIELPESKEKVPMKIKETQTEIASASSV